MTRLVLAVLSVLCVESLLQLGCADSENKISGEIENLKVQVDSLKANQESMLLVLRTLFSNQSKLLHDQVIIDPASKGFQRLDANNGSFLISVEDVQPYLNGYKLLLSIGNPLDMTFDGLIFKITWGKFRKEESYEDWHNKLNTRDISVVNEIRPGSWNKVELLLVPAGASDLEYISLQIETNQVRLRNW